jgi:hypothetical protein
LKHILSLQNFTDTKNDIEKKSKMSRGLPPEFVENRIHTLTHVPVDWNVDIREKYYELDLKMSQMIQENNSKNY